MVGPGSYEQYAKSFKRPGRAATTQFSGARSDVFKTNNNPGPQAYNASAQTFGQKAWGTNIGAFGTTEKKFASIHST